MAYLILNAHEAERRAWVDGYTAFAEILAQMNPLKLINYPLH